MKTAFVFVLFLLVYVATPLDVHADAEADVELHVDGPLFTVEGGTFTHEVELPDEAGELGMLKAPEGYVVFGDIVRRSLQTYDGYLLWLDPQGNVVREELYDWGGYESVREVLFLDGNLVAQIDQRQAPGRTWQDFAYGHVHLYSADSLIRSIDTDAEVDIHLEQGVVNIEGRNPERSYDHVLLPTGELLIEALLYGVEDGGEYNSEVTLHVHRWAELNGERIEGISQLRYPGHYRLETHTRLREFTLHAELEGVEPEGTYDSGVEVTLAKGKLSLNGEPQPDSFTIEDPGNHVLTIEGVGGYEEEVFFTVRSELDAETFEEPLEVPYTLEFSGIGHLNNHRIDSGEIISDPGDYTLIITGEGDYEEVHRFTLFEESESLPRFLRLEFGILAIVSVVVGSMIIWRFFRH